jgi:hypothetical protein
MTDEHETDRGVEAGERRAEVCKASVRLSATLALATAIGVAVVVFLLWQFVF